MKGIRSGAFCGLSVLLVTAFFSQRGFSHCQVPCGIYGDEMRFEMMEEHITTIEKAMKEIESLSKEQDKNYNQIVRWVNAKEEHADELSRIVTFYFMTQRVKPVEEKDGKAHREYLKKLELLHRMLYYSMKAKQSTDLSNVEMLRSLVSDFRKAYFGEKADKHKH